MFFSRLLCHRHKQWGDPLFFAFGKWPYFRFVWGLFTYAFLHDGPFHRYLTFSVYFLLVELWKEICPRRDLFFSATAALTGGIFWLVFNYNSGILIGTSAVVTACLCYFCLNRPNDPVSFLLFFVLPVSLKPKIILFAIVGIELYGFIFTELQQSGAIIAHSAHLGGLMVGFITFSLKKKNYGIPTFKFNFPEKKHSPNKFYKTNPKNHSKKDYKVDISDYNAMQSEVDRILDKINSKGFGSLTPIEKDCLEKAKTFLNKNP